MFLSRVSSLRTGVAGRRSGASRARVALLLSAVAIALGGCSTTAASPTSGLFGGLIAGISEPERKPAPEDAEWSREIHPDTSLLFRYSAVTFNAHKIHYDYPYATEVEGYPALIVHGQLIATFLLDNWQRNNPNDTLTQFSFKAMSPLFCGETFKAQGKPADSGNADVLWACTTEGGLTMQADVAWK